MRDLRPSSSVSARNVACTIISSFATVRPRLRIVVSSRGVHGLSFSPHGFLNMFPVCMPRATSVTSHMTPPAFRRMLFSVFRMHVLFATAAPTLPRRPR